MPDQTVIEQQMNDMRLEMREMRGVLGQMAQALTKLSILEERNLVATQAIEKIGERIEKVEDKIGDVVLEQTKAASTIAGVTGTMKVMWTAFGSGVIYLGAQAFQAIAK